MVVVEPYPIYGCGWPSTTVCQTTVYGSCTGVRLSPTIYEINILLASRRFGIGIFGATVTKNGTLNAQSHWYVHFTDTSPGFAINCDNASNNNTTVYGRESWSSKCCWRLWVWCTRKPSSLQATYSPSCSSVRKSTDKYRRNHQFFFTL